MPSLLSSIQRLRFPIYTTDLRVLSLSCPTNESASLLGRCDGVDQLVPSCSPHLLVGCSDRNQHNPSSSPRQRTLLSLFIPPRTQGTNPRRLAPGFSKRCYTLSSLANHQGASTTLLWPLIGQLAVSFNHILCLPQKKQRVPVAVSSPCVYFTMSPNRSIWFQLN